MTEASKTSFLGSISPWSRTGTPPPKSPQQRPADEGLKPSSGLDHAISLRPSPSLKRYPKDCPPLKARWYYAIDVAKRKPFAPQQPTDENDKSKPAPPAPKKWLMFSSGDSQAIENAFQALGKNADSSTTSESSKETSTKVPVNEDYLFDVHIEKRELEPAYWLGPVYEVRRGSWFWSEGSILRPCEENLANQLEEGYLKVMPWRRSTAAARSASLPRSRTGSTLAEAGNLPFRQNATTETPSSNTHRLFGSHMNTTATYQDATSAYLSTDDFMSRMSSTVRERFGVQAGTKVVRGYVEASKIADAKSSESTATKDKRRSAKLDSKADEVIDMLDSAQTKPRNATQTSARPSALERQLSSLAGLTASKSHDEERLEEEQDAQEQEQQEMEDLREKDGEDQARRIDHLLLVTHGIGQRLGLRLDSINFVHDVNTMRKTMKAMYEASPDLQALTDEPKNCTIQVLPICWRHMLDFPKQSLKQNRKEFDLGDLDSSLEDEYPSLQDITVEGVPAVRNLITDLALDVLLYQSAYREHIARIVQKEANRVYSLFRQRTGFKGKVSLCGHSLGSAVLFDILCRQGEASTTRPRRVSSKTSRDTTSEEGDVKLDFECDGFYALGSPIALFQMLKGRTVAGRQALQDRAPLTSPFDADKNDPMLGSVGNRINNSGSSSYPIPITTSSPKCTDFYNIFHPTDPIAYRVEPLISSAMAQMKPQALPYVKRGLFAAPGIANLSARVGQQVMSGWYNLTSGVASSLINRSLGITGEEQALAQDKPRTATATVGGSLPPLQPGSSTTASAPTMPTADSAKQQAVADAVAAQSSAGPTPTLIDGELETLYEGFQRHRQRRPSATSTASTAKETKDEHHRDDDDDTTAQTSVDYALEQERARKLRREEAKVRALNANGRVDYHIQEGMFDVSLLASIASHLGYWADEDVNHFMVGQMLKRARRDRMAEKEGGGSVPDRERAFF